MPVFARAGVVGGGVSVSGPACPPCVPRVGVPRVGGVGAGAVPGPGGASRVNDVSRGATYLGPLALQPVGGPLLGGVIAQSTRHLVTLSLETTFEFNPFYRTLIIHICVLILNMLIMLSIKLLKGLMKFKNGAGSVRG